MELNLIDRRFRWGIALVLAAGLAVGGGCGRSRSGPDSTSGDAAGGGARHFPLTGLVLAVDPSRKVVRVQHDEIKGLMPAMTMEFAVADGDLTVAREGHRIRATLVQEGTEFSLESLWPDDPETTRAIAAGSAALKQDTVIRGAQAYREVGETVPDFTLLDQAGRVVQINRFRGKQVVLNFIFTRCPVPTMCPAATTRMVALQQAARAAGIPNLELISVTLDPINDTPGMLRDYAAVRGIDTANFSLLTGPESAIRDLLAQMGVIAEFKDGFLRHTLATLLIDENGKIVWREDGSVWDPQVFIQRMKRN